MKRLFLISIVLLFSISNITAQEDSLTAYQKYYNEYVKSYPFMQIKDTVYNFDSQYKVPDGYKLYKDKDDRSYANWMSHFPLWHSYKDLQNWKQKKIKKYDEITNGVHLPWYGPSYRDIGIPIRLMMEYKRLRNQDIDWNIIPVKGDTLTYEKWLNHKASRDYTGAVILKPSESRDSSYGEFIRFINFAMDNSSYQSLPKNCVKISEPTDLKPGDMFIASDSTGKQGLCYVILNVANKKNEVRFIAATGCAEACDFHIPKFNEERTNPWIDEKILNDLSKDFPFSGFYRFK